jgi:hypothetical protein
MNTSVFRHACLALGILLGIACFILQSHSLDQTGLLFYMPFDGDANDASGNGNDGETMENTAWVAGQFGKALKVNGDGYVEIPHNDSLSIKRDFTIELWVNMEDLHNTNSSFVTKPDSYMFHVDGEPGSATAEFFLCEPLVWVGGFDAWRTTANVKVPMNEWAHVATIYDGTEHRTYVNGELKGTYVRSVGGDLDSNTDPVVIGKDNRTCCNTRLMTAVLDEVRVWTRVLSDAEIKEVMNPTAVEAQDKLVMTWARIKKTQ